MTKCLDRNKVIFIIYITEDEVRYLTQETIQPTNTSSLIAGLGQLTTFSELGSKLNTTKWNGLRKKPDGWILPKNGNRAIIIELKDSRQDLSKPEINFELKHNMHLCQIVYPEVIGILFNGYQSKVFQLNSPNKNVKEIKALSNQLLQPYQYYLNVNLSIKDPKVKDQVHINNVKHASTATQYTPRLPHASELDVANYIKTDLETTYKYSIILKKWMKKTKLMDNTFWTQSNDNSEFLYVYINKATKELQQSYNTQYVKSLNTINHIIKILKSEAYLGTKESKIINSIPILNKTDSEVLTTLMNLIKNNQIIITPQSTCDKSDVYDTLFSSSTVSKRKLNNSLKLIFPEGRQRSRRIYVGFKIINAYHHKSAPTELTQATLIPKLQTNKIYQSLYSFQRRYSSFAN